MSNINVFSSMSSMDEKKFFLKLRKEYLIIKNIKDYNDKQSKLYGNKSRKEIIDFEITRIRKSDNFSSKVDEKVNGITELLNFIGDELTDELYEKIINLIIKIELFLDIKVGLFNELCVMYDKEMNIRSKTNTLSEDVLIYKKIKGE